MSDNNKKRKIIFDAELLDNKTIKVNVYSNFVPMLTFAQKLLDLNIENLIIGQDIQNNVKKITPVDLTQLGKLRIDGFKL